MGRQGFVDETRNWIRRYILFHNRRHPLEMGKGEVGAFLAGKRT